MTDLQRDFEILITKIITERCINLLSKVYTTNIFTRATNLIKAKRDEFKSKWRSYYEAKFLQNESNYPKVIGSWFKAAGPKRDYNILQNYKITTP
jgi:hypothetical protein